SGHGLTGLRPTAKPNDSSAPCSTAGPTEPSTHQAANAPKHLTAGSGTTTIDEDTQPSATDPRSAEPTCLGPTPSPAPPSVGKMVVDYLPSARPSASSSLSSVPSVQGQPLLHNTPSELPTTVPAERCVTVQIHPDALLGA